MHFQSLRVRNYRSVATEQTIDLPNGLTIVGPNNSGKTNLLRAVQLFFTGFDNSKGYRREADLTFGKNREQTTLVATFRANGRARDSMIFETYDRILDLYTPPRTRSSDELQLQLIFSNQGNPSYRLSSDTTTMVPRENQSAHSRLIRQLVDDLASGFSVHYVPSAKSSEAIFADVVSPLLKQSVAAELTDEILALQKSLGRISGDLNDALTASGMNHLEVNFEVPGPATGGFLSYFDFQVSDPEETSVFDKGRGIQSLAMFACFAWIARRESAAGQDSFWLVEEPESYLHPQLYDNARRLIESIEKEGQVVKTTHALGLVPGEPGKILGCTSDAHGRTETRGYPTTAEATRLLRSALGVRFSDYFGLTEYNVFVEGESDVRLIQWATNRLDPGAMRWPRLSQASIRAFGGTPGLKAFLTSNYEHIRPERSAVSVFDGDEAGISAVRAINKMLVNKGGAPFISNRDYVVARKDRAIEGLFPDAYLKAAHDREPAWFDQWLEDASDVLLDFHIRDQSKRAVENFLLAAAEESASDDEWSEHWVPALSAIENALEAAKPPE